VAMQYRSLSFWHDSLGDSFEPRDSLQGSLSTDVAIVGAGYTGLWTAYYLKKADPNLDVAIVEAEVAGFGASGRNGGWCVAELAGVEQWLADDAKREGALSLMRAVFETVDEVGRVAEAEEIACDYAKGGTITVATTKPHVRALQSQLAKHDKHGFTEADYRWLEPDECHMRVKTQTNLGGIFLSHCAALHPAKLARGLGDVVERFGAKIYERSPVRSIRDRTVLTDSGSVHAGVVLRATEGYTPTLEGNRRKLLPVHTMMVATEPLPDSMWDEIGLPGRETFGDGRRVTIYGQRTADGRMAFGSRGDYYFGSDIRDIFPANHDGFADIQATLVELFPILRDAEITHRWGGALGVPRNLQASVGIDRVSGRAWAGGYVGAGVAASNLAGRTMADLILERDSELVTLPCVGTPFPRWEREPARWLGTTAVRALAQSLDRAEMRRGHTPRLRSRLFRSFVG
jgi:glycine/D-amino acid oxidase-like deaminating enzyme